VSIIIDFERIGDYTKNIAELAENHKARLQGGDAEEDLKRVEDALVETFDRLRAILEKSDEEAAKKLIEEYLWINPLCDKYIIAQIRQDDKSISGGCSVALALYFRYLKRIHSHLRNVTTSIYRPFHKIGFVSWKHLQQ
jgi:Na+/phosphate symporter